MLNYFLRQKNQRKINNILGLSSVHAINLFVSWRTDFKIKFCTLYEKFAAPNGHQYGTDACADPECFVRRVQLSQCFFYDEGREHPNTPIS